MNYKLIFDSALIAGEIMLQNGAETYRVEDTINRILSTSNLAVIESFVTPTGLFVTLDDPTIDSMTMVRRVVQRTIHMGKVEQVNSVSRDYVSGNISIEDAHKRLKDIRKRPPYSPGIHVLSFGMISACFTLVFGGDLRDFAASLIVGLCLGFFHTWLSKKQISRFMNDIISSILLGSLCVLLTKYIPLGNELDHVIVGCIMPLVPGLAITTAIRDTIEGHLVSGLARASEAFLIAISIAVGVAISFSLFM